MAVDLRACAAAVLPALPPGAPHTDVLAAAAAGAPCTPAAVLSAAATLLLDYTEQVAAAFRGVLTELVVRATHAGGRDPAVLHALARLVGAFEEVYEPIHDYIRATFPDGVCDASLERLVALYRLVRAAPALAAPWPSAPLYAIFAGDAPPTLRFLALEAFCIQESLAPAARDSLLARWIGDTPAPLAYGDVRTLALAEDARIASMWTPAPTDTHQPLRPRQVDLSPTTRVVGGIILYTRSECAPPASSFVTTPAAAHALRDVALRYALRLPILLSGPAACGKTHLLEHLGDMLGQRAAHGAPQVLSIQLGDQSGVDAKQLVGSFVSSSTRPGSFEWVAGALTRAVAAGMWVVLEDIDRASGDVLSVLAPLIEALGPTKRIGARPVLDLGARGSVTAAPGFALFATRTAAPGTAPRFLTASHWAEVHLAPPTHDDLCDILSCRFPPLAALPRAELACLVRAWSATAEALAPTGAAGGSGSSSTRRITLRELIRWGARVSQQPQLRSLFANPVVQEEVFLDGCDLFLAAIPPESRVPVARLADALADALHMDSARAAWALRERVPELAVRNALHAGRAVLPRRPGAPSSLPRYALTRPTLGVLERVAAGVAAAEPLLLVGETGTGKTTMVQNIAALLGKRTTVVNMSQQTESGDLLGAYKPVDPVRPASALHNTWAALFERSFSLKRNAAFLDAERRALVRGRWARLVKLWEESARMAAAARDALARKGADADAAARKRRRTDDTYPRASEWDAFIAGVREFAALYTGRRSFVFSYVEGPLVHALREGHWLLLDELNLAAPEALECLAPLLQSASGSVVLAERGDVAPVPRHPEFRIFGCMNPATDVGKRDLPPPLRSRFTEVYVPSPDSDIDALVAIVTKYIGEATVGDQGVVLDVAEWYASVCRLAGAHELADGCNQRPHYSVRTLARALTFATCTAPDYGIRRALAEGLFMAFGTLLDAAGQDRVRTLIDTHILSKSRDKRRAARSYVPPARENHVHIGPFWLRTGTLPPAAADDYVCTPSVQAKLEALARPLVTRQSPVLIQGPTSAGKTSAVEYLARRTGHRFVRINNHEHTDVQEYLGAYTSGADGGLVFAEGMLVTALRRGDWIVLDELNLAPTDVLEALNRLLDDNRELIIPETGEVVRPHPDFMLFATQNPPGAYAGRKALSRAFRNRFVELHFGDVPQDELATILTHRCAIAPSYAERIVHVFTELQRRREAERVFERHAFATLRDLFRWGARPAVGVGQLADTGYMLIAERARQPGDRDTVRRVLEDVLRVKIEPHTLYTLDEGSTALAQLGRPRADALRAAAAHCGIVWTGAMSRLVVLAALALVHREPVLLVGETGAGKTSVCDVLAHAFGVSLHSFNCHQNTDSSDLLGGQRPLRDRSARQAAAAAEAAAVLGEHGVPVPAAPDDLIAALDGVADDRARHARHGLRAAQALFEWCDGPLVHAMRHGDAILLDEVSLADDSVLERLNSVLETERTLVLAEKAGAADAVITAADGFAVIATMNPGGDYGKKELSPALRNRFTEVWVPPVDSPDDQAAIVGARLPPELHTCIEPMLAFGRWLGAQVGDPLGVRDLLAWASFVCATTPHLGAAHAFAHGAALVAIDGLGATAGTAAMPQPALTQLRHRAYARVNELIAPAAFDPDDPALLHVHRTPDALWVGPFALPARGGGGAAQYALDARTTAANALRVLRASATGGRSVLLEGSPGAGKTSLVTALAALTGHTLTRINLSDQTELVDLFGAELPVPGGRAGEFEWRPAAFLRAMQNGEWVLLDEMNLASQTVLEGLNSCLDHRGSVYVAEIGRTFAKHPDFRVFAAQNPHHQGGARKGLPRSLLNRFSKVFVTELTDADALTIGKTLYPALQDEMLAAMVGFNGALQRAAAAPDAFAQAGAPWEFNLRDVLRWLALVHTQLGASAVGDALEHIVGLYLLRFRTRADREKAASLATHFFGRTGAAAGAWSVGADSALVGHSGIARGAVAPQRCTALLPQQLAVLSAMADSLHMGWLTILTGPTSTGKTSLVRLLADMHGVPLEELRLSNASDTMDVLGSFEQRDPAVTRTAVLAGAHEAASAAVHAAAAHGGDVAALERARRDLSADGAARDAALALLEQSVAPTHVDTIRALRAHLAAGNDASAGTFEWVDGPLVRAARRGAWLLLDNANLCSASVLDRLNSLFESPPSLALSERGMVNGEVPQLAPHPAFRVFMTLDPRHGELSRAMRNRGIELWIDTPATPPIRGPPTDGTPIARAVAAHATRRGFHIPMHAPPPACDLSEAPLADARFVLTQPLSEELIVYAAQALRPAELRLVTAMHRGAADALAAAAAAVAPYVAVRNAHLATLGIHVGALVGADARRTVIARFFPDADAAAAAVEAAVRGSMRLAELDRAPETSIIQRSRARDPELPHELAPLHALVHGAALLVRDAHKAALPALGDVDAAAALLIESTRGTMPDYSLLRILLQTLRDAVFRVPGADALLALVQGALAPLTAHGGILLHALWARALPAADARDMELLGELERLLSRPTAPHVHTTGLELLGTLHLGTYGARRDELRGIVSDFIARAACAEYTAPRFPFVGHALPLVALGLSAWPSVPAARVVLSHGAAHAPYAPADAAGVQLAAWGAPVPAPLALRALHAAGSRVAEAALLHTALNARAAKNVPLHAWPEYERHLDELSRVLCVAPVRTRDDALRTLLGDALQLVASALADVTQAAIPEAGHLTLDSPDAARNAAQLVHASHPQLGAALVQWAECADLAHSSAAHAFVRTGLLAIDVYLPAVPLDPVAEARANATFAESLCTRARALAAVEVAAVAARAAQPHAVIEQLEHAAHTTAAAAARASQTRVVRDSDPALLSRLHRELHTFATQVLDHARIDRFIQRLAEGSGHEEAASFYASLTAFESRLERSFAPLRDLCTPFLIALSLIATGSALLAPRNARTKTLKAATQFPSIAAAHALRTSKAPSRASAVPELLAALRGAVYDRAAGVSVSAADVSPLYDQLYVIWAAERERHRAAAEEKASIYVHKAVEETDEQAALEAELARLFPTYDNVLEDEQGSRSRTETAARLDDAAVQAVADAHVALFATAADQPAFDAFVAAAERLAIALASNCAAPGTAALDTSSAVFQVRTLAPRAPLERANFYHDAQPQETGRIAPILTAMQSRIAAALVELPEQQQLIQLSERCDRVESLAAQSPIAKVLAAIEQLLVLIDDWETFASRETSMRSFANELTSLVIEWRRLELSSWEHLLNDETESESRTASLWFFSLYEALARGGGERIRELVELLDTFMRQSSAAQYAARLRLVRAFGTYAATIDKRVADMLHSIAAFYAQFTTRVSDVIDKQRALLERDIREYIKLASWRDINVYSLRMSAQKTHTYLLRTLRKFRDVLRQPVDPILAAAGEDRPAIVVRTLQGSTAPIPESCRVGDTPAPESTQTAQAHLADAPKVVARLRSLCEKKLLPTLCSSSGEALAELGDEILSTADDLAQQTPAASTEDNEKAIKALATQKRRAWADLLRELRRLGLTSGVSADVLARNRDAATVYAIPAPRGGCASEALATDTADAYHVALLAQLPRVRAATASPQRDVPTLELQRALAYIEHAAGHTHALRRRAAHFLDGSRRVWDLAQRICTLARAEHLVRLDEHQIQMVHAIQCATAHISAAFEEFGNVVALYARVSPLECHVPTDDVKSLHERAAGLYAYASGVKGALALGIPVCTEDEYEHLRSYGALLQDADRVLAQTANGVAAPAMLLREWLGKIPKADLGSHEQYNTASEAEDTGRIRSSILVIAQEVNALSPISTPLGDRAIPEQVAHITAVERVLRPHEISDAICAAFTTNSVHTPREIAPFLGPYTELLFAHASTLSIVYRALARLGIVLCIIVTNLAVKGFCTPPVAEQEETGEGEEGGEQLEGGTGLGDGQGAKDISETLQDDENMEELDNTQDEGATTEQEKGARESEQVDGGDTQSVEDSGQQDGQDEDEPEQDDIDDEIGGVDPLDPGAVDEKMWDEEQKDDTQAQSEAQGGFDNNRESAGERNEADGRENDGEGEEPESEPEPEPEPSVEDMPEQGLGRNVDDEARNEMQLDDVQLSDDEQNKEDNEELSDDDRDAGGDDQDTTKGDHDATDMETDEKDVEQQDAEADDGDQGQENNVEEQGDTQDGTNDDPLGAEDEEDADDPGNAEAGSEAQEHEQEPAEEDAGDEAGEHEDDMAHGDNAADAPEEHPKTDLSNAPDRPEANPNSTLQTDTDADDAGGDNAGAAGGQQESAGRQGDASHASIAAEASTQEAPDAGAEGAAEAEGGSGGGETAAEAKEQEGGGGTSEERINPVSSLSDSLERFRKDVDAIGDATENAGDAADAQTGNVEHVADDDHADAEAAGAADEQQAQQTRGLYDADGDNEAPPPMEDNDDEDVEKPENDDPLDFDRGDAAGSTAAPGERAIGAADVRAENEDTDSQRQVEEGQHEEVEPLSAEERAMRDDTVAFELAEARASDYFAARAAELWRSYVSLTADLAFGLCEQLRLILVPTLATRLNGDFRTGKRLNMRKIIPFIASDFAKDKIWLRRTKPSAREYQVLLAIDDSKSMAEGRNIHLAYQTLALVSGALSRLEVGDIGICRFGKGVDMLHEFGHTAFSDAHGGDILSRLRFEQTDTNMPILIERSLHVLQEARMARASASAADLWQLEIIISDGVCQDHDKLRALLRRAAEERVMIVFVIVDADQGQEGHSGRSSILSMNQVNYHTDAAGRLQLDMRRYIDTFPFEHYVIVRDVHALPAVLATTLRQWAERIRDV